MTENLPARRKVLVLAPSLQGIGGIQNYVKIAVDALRETSAQRFP